MAELRCSDEAGSEFMKEQAEGEQVFEELRKRSRAQERARCVYRRPLISDHGDNLPVERKICHRGGLPDLAAEDHVPARAEAEQQDCGGHDAGRGQDRKE